MSYKPNITLEDAAVTRFPCGDKDESGGHLWTTKRHCQWCEDRRCKVWLLRFEAFRSMWIERFPPHTQRVEHGQ